MKPPTTIAASSTVYGFRQSPTLAGYFSTAPVEEICVCLIGGGKGGCGEGCGRTAFNRGLYNVLTSSSLSHH